MIKKWYYKRKYKDREPNHYIDCIHISRNMQFENVRFLWVKKYGKYEEYEHIESLFLNNSYGTYKKPEEIKKEFDVTLTRVRNTIVEKIRGTTPKDKAQNAVKELVGRYDVFLAEPPKDE